MHSSQWLISYLYCHSIFFQIEREYILQNLGVIPSLKPEEVFTTSDTNYQGPELPSRYRDLILPYDWYVPGKGRRRKRKHKASHGLISFMDLSKRISTLWKTIDRETKLYCSEVSDIGMQKYRLEKQERDKAQGTQTKKSRPTKSTKATKKSKSKTAAKKDSEEKASQQTSNTNIQTLKSDLSVEHIVKTSSMNNTLLTSKNFYHFQNNAQATFRSLEAANFVLANQAPSVLSSNNNDMYSAGFHVQAQRRVSSETQQDQQSRYISDVDMDDDDIIDMYMKSQINV